MTFQETYGFACGSFLVGKLSVWLRAVKQKKKKTKKKSEKRNVAVRIVMFTVSLNSHLERISVALNVADARQVMHMPKGALQ